MTFCKRCKPGGSLDRLLRGTKNVDPIDYDSRAVKIEGVVKAEMNNTIDKFLSLEYKHHLDGRKLVNLLSLTSIEALLRTSKDLKFSSEKPDEANTIKTNFLQTHKADFELSISNLLSKRKAAKSVSMAIFQTKNTKLSTSDDIMS